MADASGRLMGALPAIFRATDDAGHLRALLAAFETVLLESGDASAPAIAEEIDTIPTLFAPLGVEVSAELPTQEGPVRIQGHKGACAPERFLPWLAQWVAFSPNRYFAPERLRSIVAGIVPLYGRRGTREYLEKLLALCFDEIDDLSIDEDPLHGFVIGRARLNEDSVLDAGKAFRFRVEILVREHAADCDAETWQALDERVRAVVEFARPAHTEYDLVLRKGTRGTPNAEETADQ
jgi:hypothetical protein